jgi:hypothetical protein
MAALPEIEEHQEPISVSSDVGGKPSPEEIERLRATHRAEGRTGRGVSFSS